jgi:hypothetical protein
MSSGSFVSTNLRSVAILGIVLTLLIVLLGFGYIFNNMANPGLSANRAKWDETKPTSYSYLVTPSCFCGREDRLSYTVIVHAEHIDTEVEKLWGPDFAGRAIDAEKVMTIERVFEIASTTRAEVAEISVEYDETFGFPAHIEIVRSREVTDTGYQLKISDFKVL